MGAGTCHTIFKPNCNFFATTPKKLQHFLAQYDQIEMIADWPEDFALLMRCLILAPGQSMYLPDFSMQLWMNQQTEQHIPSVQPHNALSDAQALQYSYFAVNSAK